MIARVVFPLDGNADIHKGHYGIEGKGQDIDPGLLDPYRCFQVILS